MAANAVLDQKRSHARLKEGGLLRGGRFLASTRGGYQQQQTGKPKQITHSSPVPAQRRMSNTFLSRLVLSRSRIRQNSGLRPACPNSCEFGYGQKSITA